MPTISEILLTELAHQIVANPAYRLKPGTAGEIEMWLKRHFRNDWGDSPVSWRNPKDEANIVFDEMGIKAGGIADYMAVQREVRPYLFIEDEPAPATAPTVTRRSDLPTPADRARWIGQHGAEAYSRLED